MRVTISMVLVLAIAGCNRDGLGFGDGDGGVDLGGIDLSGIDLTHLDLSQPPSPPPEPPPPPPKPSPCGQGPALPAGPLCGSSTLACRVLADEALPTPAAFRNDAPAIAVGADGKPRIFFSSAEGSFRGFVATRGTGGFTLEDTPIGAATGALAIAPDGSTRLLLDDGATHVYYAVEDGTGWQSTQILSGAFSAEGALAVDSAGCEWGGISYADALAFGWRNNVWGFELVSPMLYGDRPHVALSPSGRPEWVAFGSGGGQSLLAFAAPPDAPETVVGGAGSVTVSDGALLAVADDGTAIGEPHVLFAGDALMHAVRDAGVWRTEVIDRFSFSESGTCAQAPGAVCTRDSVTLAPVGMLVAQSGGPRFVYLRNHSSLTQTWSCPGFILPPHGESSFDMAPPCNWETTASSMEAALTIASSVGGQVTRAALPVKLTGGVGRAVADAAGTIHVALYDGDGVRYLAIGP